MGKVKYKFAPRMSEEEFEISTWGEVLKRHGFDFKIHKVYNRFAPDLFLFIPDDPWKSYCEWYDKHIATKLSKYLEGIND